MTGVERVLDPWLERTTTHDRRMAVVEAIAKAAEQYSDLFRQAAPIDESPLVRWIDVPEADASIRVLLTNPHRGLHLLGIFDVFMADGDET